MTLEALIPIRYLIKTYIAYSEACYLIENENGTQASQTDVVWKSAFRLQYADICKNVGAWH